MRSNRCWKSSRARGPRVQRGRARLDVEAAHASNAFHRGFRQIREARQIKARDAREKSVRLCPQLTLEESGLAIDVDGVEVVQRRPRQPKANDSRTARSPRTNALAKLGLIPHQLELACVGRG